MINEMVDGSRWDDLLSNILKCSNEKLEMNAINTFKTFLLIQPSAAKEQKYLF